MIFDDCQTEERPGPTTAQATDALLRLNGYRIFSRPRYTESLWQAPSGKILTQIEALRHVAIKGGITRRREQQRG